MDHFDYRNGELHAEDVPLSAIATEVGTPFYCYSTATLTRHFRVFEQALGGLDAEIYYAVKANGNLAVLTTLARLGAGADVVSGGELTRALAAGVPAAKIVFSGVGKTRDEMVRALRAGIKQINVESEPELDALSAVARELGLRASIAVRVNPDVDARTHAKITTGKSENKFGVDISRATEIYARAANLPGIDVTGVAVHIGSQLTDLAPYRAAYGKVADLVGQLRAEGHRIDVVDLGGGLGIPYGAENPPTPAEYGAMVAEVVGHLGCRVGFEPGRMIAGNAGILVARVVYAKDGESHRFLILDAAMNDLIRPTLYEAHHEIVAVAEPAADAPRLDYDVVGPVCETGDTFGRGRALPEMAAGDLVALRSAGAYGAVMASTYNSRPLVPEVMVDGDRFAVVARRIDTREMMAREALPPWLEDSAPGPREARG